MAAERRLAEILQDAKECEQRKESHRKARSIDPQKTLIPIVPSLFYDEMDNFKRYENRVKIERYYNTLKEGNLDIISCEEHRWLLFVYDFMVE